MSETTDAVIGVWPSGFREASLGALTETLKGEMDDVFPMVGDAAFVAQESDYLDDSEEIHALPGATEAIHKRTRGTLSRTLRLAVEPLTDLMAWGTGNIDSGAATSAVNEVQKITKTGTITAGGYKLRDKKTGKLTAEIAYDAADTAVDTALEAIVGAGNVAVVLASSVYTATFGGALAATNYPELELIETTPIVGGTIVVSTFTEGSAAGQYLHTIQEPSICTLNPHSFPYAEGARCDGIVDSFRFFPGVVTNSVGWDIGNDDFINMAVEMLQCGKELPVGSFTFPLTDSARTALLNTMVELWIGDNFTNTYKVGLDELAAWSVRFNFGVVEPERISNSPTVPEYQFPKGGMTIDLSATFKGGRSSRFYSYIDACRYGYRPKMRLRIDPKSTPQRPLELDFNKLNITAGRIVPAGREQRTELTFQALSNVTDNGRFTLKTITAISEYLQLAA